MKPFMLFAALLSAVTPGLAHKIRVDFDHGAGFSHYKTYRLIPSGDPRGQNLAVQNPLMQDRIGGFIEQALAAKGLKRTTSGEDLQVYYRIDVTEQPVFTTISDGWGSSFDGGGWGPGWGSGYSTTTVQMYYQGLLVVEMVDAHRQAVVFQGTSSQSVSSKPEKNNKKLSKAVTEVIGRYPPQQ